MSEIYTTGPYQDNHGNVYWYATAVHYEREGVRSQSEMEALQKLRTRLQGHHDRMTMKIAKLEDAIQRIDAMTKEMTQ
jgi:hypothetical protein